MDYVKCSDDCILGLNTKKCQLSLQSALLSKRQSFSISTSQSNNNHTLTKQFIALKLTDIGD